MIDTIKPHYITIQPLRNMHLFYGEDEEIIETMPISSLYDLNGYELMDHIFYINSVSEFSEYELLYDFCELVMYMTKHYFEGIENINNANVIFKDSKTDEPLFSITIFYDEYDDIDYIITSLSKLHKQVDEDECDGDCENCDFYKFKDYDDECIDEELLEDEPEYFFGME